LAAIRRTDDSGRRVHSKDAVRHFVPWMAVNMKVDYGALPPPIQALVSAFIEGLELPENATYDDLLAATDAFYAESPLDPKLKHDVDLAMRNALTELSANNSGEDAHRRIGKAGGVGVFRQALASDVPADALTMT
ncbi:MAG: hypothetical protein AAFV29_02985, partial [Myxococcota bacterium]